MTRSYFLLVFCAFTFNLSLVSSHAQKPHSFVADAKREYAAIFSHTDNPCAKESVSTAYQTCISEEVNFIASHLANFVTAVRRIEDNDLDPTAAPARLRPSETDLLNKADLAWRQYQRNLCSLTSSGMEGGSGAVAAELECEYKSDRQYVQQLADAVYLRILAE